jgi:ATP-dependent exoDNAse (exonuclease V) alpha subunit
MIDYINRKTCGKPDESSHYLTMRNKTANRINQEKLDRLNDTQHISMQEVIPGAMADDPAVKQCPVNKPLSVKKGMKIMFVLNDNKANDRRWVNGTLGEVAEKNVAGNDIVSVRIKTGANEYEVTRENYEIYKPVFNENTNTPDTTKIAEIRQFPFVACWASTIAKSQGLTLEKIAIDLKDGVNSHGLCYVAFSRTRRLEDISLVRPLKKQDIVVSRQISSFYESLVPYIEKVDK